MRFPQYNEYKIKLIKYSISILVVFAIVLLIFDQYFMNKTKFDARDYIADKFFSLVNWQRNLSWNLSWNVSELSQDESQKIEEIFEYNKIDSLESIDQLNNYIANIKLLEQDYDVAIDKLSWDDWRYYYNLWNINLLKWYSMLSWDDYEKILESYGKFLQAIDNYNMSAQLAWTWNSLWKKIISNRTNAYSLKYLSGIKLVTIVVKNLSEKLKDVQNKVDELNKIFEEQIGLVKNLLDKYKDKSTRECLLSLNKELWVSVSSIDNIKSFIKFFKSWLEKKLRSALDDPDSSVTNINWFFKPSETAIQKILNSLDSYLEKAWYMNIALKSNNQDIIKSLCESWRWDSNKENQQLNEWLDELNKLLWDNPQGQKSGDKQDQSPKTSNDPMHQQIPQWYEQKLMENLKRQNDEWIKQMQQLKTQSWYDPKQYLDKLFKDFYWNDKDFSSSQWGELEKFDRNW